MNLKILIWIFAILLLFGCVGQKKDNPDDSSLPFGDKEWLSKTVTQCNDDWDKWIKTAPIQFLVAPTKESLIRLYYEQVHKINILKTVYLPEQKVDACLECGCSGGHVFVLVNSFDAIRLKLLGWQEPGHPWKYCSTDADCKNVSCPVPAAVGYYLKSITCEEDRCKCNIGNSIEENRAKEVN